MKYSHLINVHAPLSVHILWHAKTVVFFGYTYFHSACKTALSVVSNEYVCKL